MAVINLYQYVRTQFQTYLTKIKSEVNAKEPALGNPASNGLILSSTTAGVRSWTSAGSGDAMRAGGNNFTGVQTTGISNNPQNTYNAIDFSLENNFVWTATTDNVTASNLTAGQSGVLIIKSSENITGWSSEFVFKDGVPTDLTGDETFGYFIENSTTIRIGRMY